MTINQESGLIIPSYFFILTCYHPNQILYMGISINEISIKSLQLQYNTQNDYCFIKKKIHIWQYEKELQVPSTIPLVI
jgi:hypothetical protein